MWPFKRKPASRLEPWEERFAAHAPLVLASDEVIGPQRKPVGRVERVAPNNRYDSGWLFYSGEESQQYLDEHPPKLCPLSRFLALDPSLAGIVESPVGSAWERDDDGAWRQLPVASRGR